MNDDQQKRTSRGNTLHLPKRAVFIAKGHDAILKKIQDEGGFIEIQPISSEGLYQGKLIARDRYSITIKCPDGRERTVYKHAIESFAPCSVA